MTAMLIISILLAASVTGVAIWRIGALPDSISATVFVFRHKWLWTVWIWVVSLLTLIPTIDRLSIIGIEALGFGSLACLGFCGAMPLIDKDSEDMHWVFGTSGCVLSQACVFFIHHDALWVWVAFPVLFLSSYVWPDGWLGRIMKGKGVFLGEVLCYVSLVYALFELPRR